MSSRIYIMSEFCRHTPSVKSPRTELSYTRSSVSLISSRHVCGQASPALGVVPILTVGWSSVGPHHAPSRAGPAEFLVWFGGSFQHAVALTRQHVVDASRGDLAVRRSNSRGQVGRLYVCAAGMNSAHAAHKKNVRCARACCGGYAM